MANSPYYSIGQHLCINVLVWDLETIKGITELYVKNKLNHSYIFQSSSSPEFSLWKEVITKKER